MEDSIGLAKLAAYRLTERSFNSGYANSIKDSYIDKVQNHSHSHNNIEFKSNNVAPIQRAQNKLKSLYEQKSKLSYNPYKVKKSYIPISNEDLFYKANSCHEKKLTH